MLFNDVADAAWNCRLGCLRLSSSLVGLGFSTVPLKANGIEPFNSICSHARCLSILVKLVLATLALDPNGQLLVSLVARRNQAISMNALVVAELHKAFSPDSIMRGPHKIHLLQHLNAVVRERGSLSFELELVLIPLTLHPGKSQMVKSTNHISQSTIFK